MHHHRRSRATVATPILALLLWAFLPGPGAGQAGAPELAPSHERAVLELFEVMDVEAQSRVGLDYALSQPGVAGTPMASVLEEFFDRHLTWEVMRPELVRIYAETLTEAQIRQATAFYRSPAGQALVGQMPVIIERTMEMTSRLMAEHQTELQAMMMEAMGARDPR